MDACEYCGGHNAVKWDLEAGDICQTCHAEREAERRKREEARDE